MLVLAELIVCSTRGFACILAKWFGPTEISLSFTYGNGRSGSSLFCSLCSAIFVLCFRGTSTLNLIGGNCTICNSNSLAATTTIKIYNDFLADGREKNDVKNDEKKSSQNMKGTNPWFYQPNSLVYLA